MPHVIVKRYFGRSEQQKPKARGSVSIEDVESADWVETVRKPDIIPKSDTVYKKPGYNPLRQMCGGAADPRAGLGVRYGKHNERPN
jgi:4-oxalocrotonate tautomerase